ncbi:MAG: DUF4259 domain-containing protein [Pseudomonadota bacterium]
MGAWGAAPFENDDALDFVAEITSVEDLERALENETGAALIEADAAARILVVGECIAAMHGHASNCLPEDLAERLSAFGEPSQDLFEEARDAVSTVISASELSDLWADSEDRAAYNTAVTDLIARLNRPMEPAKKPSRKKPPTNRSICWICGEEMGGDFTAISVSLDPQSGTRIGGSVHLKCLNASLHPRYIVQNWTFTEESIERLSADIFGKAD